MSTATGHLTPWRRTARATVGLYGHFIRLAFLKFLAYRLRYYTGVISYTIFVSGYYYLYTALFESRAPGPDGVATMGGLTVQESEGLRTALAARGVLFAQLLQLRLQALDSQL